MADQEDDNDIWSLEEWRWIEGSETWARLVHPNGVTALPEPVGVLAGQGVETGPSPAPRRASVHIVEQDMGWVDGNPPVLAYVGEGRRLGAPAYRALCRLSRPEKGAELVTQQRSQWQILPGRTGSARGPCPQRVIAVEA